MRRRKRQQLTTRSDVLARDDDQSPNTVAIREHNEAVYADPDFIAAIVPTRDGVLTALRVH